MQVASEEASSKPLALESTSVSGLLQMLNSAARCLHTKVRCILLDATLS